jgi:hypothetical protein
MLFLLYREAFLSRLCFIDSPPTWQGVGIRLLLDHYHCHYHYHWHTYQATGSWMQPVIRLHTYVSSERRRYTGEQHPGPYCKKNGFKTPPM